MEEKKSRGRKTMLPAANSFACLEASGWMFKFISEGWLRKRWRKRYCVLSSGILYSYEQQTAEGTEKTCGSIQLKLFEDCFKASGKDCKKSPNTLILEPIKQKSDNNESSKNTNQIPRELFYTESQEELEKWISKLKESISLSNIGSDSKLKHVTKSRPRPPKGSGGNRRPPSKHHLKERARMSEDAVEKRVAEKDPPKPRGNVPLAALKPPGGLESSQTNKYVEGQAKASNLENEMPFQKYPNPPPVALKPLSSNKVNQARETTKTKLNKTEMSSKKVLTVSPALPAKKIVYSLSAFDEETGGIASSEADRVNLLQLFPDANSKESTGEHIEEDTSATQEELHGEESSKAFVLRNSQNGEQENEKKSPDIKALKIQYQDRPKSMVILASETDSDVESSSTKILFISKETHNCENHKREKPLDIRPSSLVIGST